MRMFLALMFAGVIAALATGSAEAQQKVRIYKWCLVEAQGFGGWGTTLCRFETERQCRMSMNGPWDRCVPNSYGQRP
jgi:hypothetical protein